MTTEGALLAAIRATPDDDLPRLVYADWLEENGRPEAAHAIRYACAHPDQEWTCEGDAEVGAFCPFDIDRPDPEFSQRGWCPSCQLAMADGVPERLCGMGGDYAYRRGFLWRVRCSIEQWTWFGVGRQVVSAFPIEEVEIIHLEPWREDGGDDQWGWWDDRCMYATTDDSGNLHGEVFDAMWDEYPGARHQDLNGRWMIWDTRDDAIDALNVAALLWANRQVVADRAGAVRDHNRTESNCVQQHA